MHPVGSATFQASERPCDSDADFRGWFAAPTCTLAAKVPNCLNGGIEYRRRPAMGNSADTGVAANFDHAAMQGNGGSTAPDH